jgi:hypothetical protein
MSRQEDDLAAFQFSQYKGITRLAEWCFHALFAQGGKSGHGVQAAAPDDSNFCLLQTELRLRFRE